MSDTVLSALRRVCTSATPFQPIALHEPDFRGTNAWDYVRDCIDTGWVSSAGDWVARFEKELCSCTGAEHVVAVSNGTVALRLALHLVGVQPGDEVLIPPLTFVATANAVSHLGAIPHFVDVEPRTLGMDPISLSTRLGAVAELRNGVLTNRLTGRRISAVLPVHIFGIPAEVEKLRLVCDAWGLPLVEDSAEALGSRRGGTHCGLFGAVGTLSFNGNKLITTGGGGALLTNDAELALRARHLSTTAKVPHPWAFEHDAVAWNDRLPNLNAALGVAQLEVLECRLKAKRELARRYRVALTSLEGVELIEEASGSFSNYWLVTLRFTEADALAADQMRQTLLESSHAAGLHLRPVWKLLHQLPMYTSAPRADLTVAEDQAYRLLSLPSSPQLIP